MAARKTRGVRLGMMSADAPASFDMAREVVRKEQGGTTRYRTKDDPQDTRSLVGGWAKPYQLTVGSEKIERRQRKLSESR